MPALPVLRSSTGAAEPGDPQCVDLVPEQAEYGREERERCEHRDDADEDRPDGEAAQDRVRDEHHPGQREHERDAAEHDGAACGGTRRRDRLQLLSSTPPLLPEARDE